MERDVAVNKLSVLFICVHNSGRSQIAEELLRKYGSGRFKVTSAGLEEAFLTLTRQKEVA